MTFPGNFAGDCLLIRKKSPLIHNITNYVAMEPCANALLAIGASPLMSSEPAEMRDLAAISSALAVNTGCLEERQLEAMELAAAAFSESGKPWVLDPAGAGASRFRTEAAMRLAGDFRPDVIRANASEIIALAGGRVSSRGVDSADKAEDALEDAVKLAASLHCIVSLSGRTDYITDGVTVIALANGSPMMGTVTAMGCTASAITAAFLAVETDRLAAAASAMALMGLAGEAAEKVSNGPGSFAIRFRDCLYNMDPAEEAGKIRIL